MERGCEMETMHRRLCAHAQTRELRGAEREISTRISHLDLECDLRQQTRGRGEGAFVLRV